jgi:hypothetical protein
MPEDERERVNRELIELLNELRVALPGVQLLLGFLLILPFTTVFAHVTTLQRDVYFGSFLAAAMASILLIAPSAYHRLNFRRLEKEQMLFTTNKLVIAGTALMAVAITGTVFVVTDVLFEAAVAAVCAAGIAGWIAWFWFGLPLSQREDHDASVRPTDERADGPNG